MASDLRPTFASMLDPFGVDATVTRPSPDDDPIETVVVWTAPLPTEVPIGDEFSGASVRGSGYQRQEPLRVMALGRSDVPTVPRFTGILAPESVGMPVKGWRVDATLRVEHDHVRVLVVPAPDLEP